MVFDPDDIDGLEKLSTAELKAHYKELTGRTPPARWRSMLLAHLLGYELQLKSLPKRERSVISKKLKSIEQMALPSKRKVARSGPSIGTRLIRDWNGQTYQVDVAREGYLYEGETFRSLTAIATLITGVNRNGPYFFGLRPPGQS